MDKHDPSLIPLIIETFRYDPDSGVILRTVRGKVKVAGCPTKTGHIDISMGGRGAKRRYYAHRMAYLLVNGEWPPSGAQIDHKDGNPLNNKWSNLRVATVSQNRWNRHHVGGKIPFKGVGVSRKKYTASINLHNKRRHIGCYATPEDAARAYDAKAVELFGEFAKTNFPTGQEKVS